MSDSIKSWDQLRVEADELFERAIALQDRFRAADSALKEIDADLKGAIAVADSARVRDIHKAADPVRLEFVEAHKALGKGLEAAMTAQRKAFSAAPSDLQESYHRATLEAYRKRGVVPADPSDTTQ